MFFERRLDQRTLNPFSWRGVENGIRAVAQRGVPCKGAENRQQRTPSGVPMPKLVQDGADGRRLANPIKLPKAG